MKDNFTLKNKEIIEIFKAAGGNTKLLISLLEDLFTPKELEELNQRILIFKMLKSRIPQHRIASELGVGVATVTRGSRTLQHSTNAAWWNLTN